MNGREIVNCEVVGQFNGLSFLACVRALLFCRLYKPFARKPWLTVYRAVLRLSLEESDGIKVGLRAQKWCEALFL